MSLRELARRQLDRLPQALCPASGRLGVSGPDKAAKRPVSLGVEPVRKGYSVRTPFSRPDTPSVSDSVKRPDQPDALDTSDMLDSPDISRRKTGPVIHRFSRGEIGIVADGWFLQSQYNARWYCDPCHRAARSAG
jgi:hypothetical protein